MKFKLFSIVALALGMMSCGGEQNAQQNNTESAGHKFKTLNLQNGVNVSHWLSQSEARGMQRDTQIVKADFDSIAAMGFDFVRLPVDEVHLYDENMNRDTAGFRLMHQAIEWALEDGLNVVVDLHVVRSHHFNNENDEANTLFSDPAQQVKFCNIWKDMQSDLKKYPVDRVAYEIMNEPVAPTCEHWNVLIEKTVKALREAEKDRTIIFGSNRWQIPYTFDSLRIPENDEYLVLSFHFYEPSLVTHHMAPWTEYKDYVGKINYPGMIVTDTAALDSLKPEMRKLVESMNGEYNKDSMYAHMKLAIDKAEKHGLHLFCGEYGTYPYHIDQETRLRWYRDITSVFKEHNIANCHWCYKGDFPVVNPDRSRNELPAIIAK